jgi:hypothetical protein
MHAGRMSNKPGLKFTIQCTDSMHDTDKMFKVLSRTIARQLQRKIEHVDGVQVFPSSKQRQTRVYGLLAALGPASVFHECDWCTVHAGD